jgi:hypothetical protein
VAGIKRHGHTVLAADLLDLPFELMPIHTDLFAQICANDKAGKKKAAGKGGLPPMEGAVP